MTRGRKITSPTAEPEQVERLRTNLARLNLTPSDLARLSGFAPVTVMQWFGGQARFPQPRADQLENVLLDYVAVAQTTVTLVKADLKRPGGWEKPASTQTTKRGPKE